MPTRLATRFGSDMRTIRISSGALRFAAVKISDCQFRNQRATHLRMQIREVRQLLNTVGRLYDGSMKNCTSARW